MRECFLRRFDISDSDHQVRTETLRFACQPVEVEVLGITSSLGSGSLSSPTSRERNTLIP